jgi:hypothetical protein
MKSALLMSSQVSLKIELSRKVSKEIKIQVQSNQLMIQI